MGASLFHTWAPGPTFSAIFPAWCVIAIVRADVVKVYTGYR